MSLNDVQIIEGLSAQQPRIVINDENSRPGPSISADCFELAEQLEGIVTSFESQMIRLGEACLQINQIIDDEGSLTDAQRKKVKDWFFTSIEQVSAH